MYLLIENLSYGHSNPQSKDECLPFVDLISGGVVVEVDESFIYDIVYIVSTIH